MKLSCPTPTIILLMVAVIVSVGAPIATHAGGTANFTFVTTTDFSTGSSSCIDLSTRVATNNVYAIHSDATARYWGGLVYVVNRLGQDNITRLNPTTGFSLVNQFSTGNGSNPHDVAWFSNSKIYVSRYETNTLWEMNPAAGTMTAGVSVASLADADGLSENDQLLAYGQRLFITIQRLDRNNFYSPTAASYIAVLDVSTNTFVDTNPLIVGTQPITLTHPNPFSEMQLDPFSGNLYLSCVGFFGVLDGGVEMINPVTFQKFGVIFSESAAGGDILDVEIVSPTRGYAIISTPAFVTNLIAFDPSTGVKLTTVYSPGGYDLQDIDRAPTGELYLTDRKFTNPGVRVYNAETGVQITASPISTGLPPFDLTFSSPVQTGVRGAPSSVSLNANYPNPFNPTTTIPWSIDRDMTEVRLEIFDVRGTLIRVLVSGPVQAGSYDSIWDGRDAGGSGMPGGVYFSRLNADGAALFRKMVLIK